MFFLIKVAFISGTQVKEALALAEATLISIALHHPDLIWTEKIHLKLVWLALKRILLY